MIHLSLLVSLLFSLLFSLLVSLLFSLLVSLIVSLLLLRDDLPNAALLPGSSLCLCRASSLRLRPYTLFVPADHQLTSRSIRLPRPLTRLLPARQPPVGARPERSQRHPG